MRDGAIIPCLHARAGYRNRFIHRSEMFLISGGRTDLMNDRVWIKCAKPLSWHHIHPSRLRDWKRKSCFRRKGNQLGFQHFCRLGLNPICSSAHPISNNARWKKGYHSFIDCLAALPIAFFPQLSRQDPQRAGPSCSCKEYPHGSSMRHLQVIL